MPESTLTRRTLIEAALEVLLEESARELALEFPMSTGETLHIEVRRLAAKGDAGRLSQTRGAGH